MRGVGAVLGTRAMVEVPIMRADEAREIGVDEMVIAEPPGTRVILFGRTMLAPGDGRVKLCPATTKVVDVEEAGTLVAGISGIGRPSE